VLTNGDEEDPKLGELLGAVGTEAHSKSSGGIILLLQTCSRMNSHEYDTRLATPGKVSDAQEIPQLATPIWMSSRLASSLTISGPPESR
jgi:hypothetical protein